MFTYFWNEVYWVSTESIAAFEYYECDPSACVDAVYLFRADIERTKAICAIDEAFDADLKHESISRYEKGASKVIPFSAQCKMAVNLNWISARLASETSIKGIEEALLELVLKVKSFGKRKSIVALMGLGDVGGTLALGLKLLGGEVISELWLWDINPNQAERYAIELNQITINSDLKVRAISDDALFMGDVFAFCASKYVPKVGEDVPDVRMAQLSVNAPLVQIYLEKARKARFEGLFCIVSDPVDLLCKAAFEANLSASDGLKLRPEQIRGYGLGVMYGRACYYAKQPSQGLRVFGPHGADLIVANDVEGYDDDRSRALTQKVIRANLEVRDLGFKPYIAPAIGSGALSIIKTLSGDWHESAICLGGTYWGCRNRMTPYGTEIEGLELEQSLYTRLEHSYERLEALWREYVY